MNYPLQALMVYIHSGNIVQWLLNRIWRNWYYIGTTCD